MPVSVLLFASYADALGARAALVPLETPCSVAQLLLAVRELPGGRAVPERALVAVNQRYAGADVIIELGDEVALIPPVAGG